MTGAALLHQFGQELDASQVEIIRKIQAAFGDDVMSSTQIEDWYNRLKDGRTSVESEPRSGRSNDQVIAEVSASAVVMRDRRVTNREIVEEVVTSTFSAHSIMTKDLARKRVEAKFGPKLLTVEQKQLCGEVSQDMLTSTNSDPDFMNTIITGDEKIVPNHPDPRPRRPSAWRKVLVSEN